MGESVWSHKGDMYIPKLTKNTPAIPKSNNLLIRDTSFQGRTCVGFNCTQTIEQGKAIVSKANVWQSNSNAWNWVYCLQKFWYFLSKICIWQLICIWRLIVIYKFWIRNIKIFVEDTIFIQINIFVHLWLTEQPSSKRKKERKKERHTRDYYHKKIRNVINCLCALYRYACNRLRKARKLLNKRKEIYFEFNCKYL